jgi:hypothetical protein
MQVLTPSQAYVCHKFAQDLLHWAHKQFSVHVNNLNVTPVDGGLQSLQHICIHFILIESSIF